MSNQNLTVSNQRTTIDHLGSAASEQYALNQKELDLHILSDSQRPIKSEVLVTSPSILPEFEQKFTSSRLGITTWATFTAPSKYAESAGRMFTHSLIPSLGDPDQQATRLDDFKERTPDSPSSKKEHEKIQAALELLLELESTSAQITSRRNQFQRG